MSVLVRVLEPEVMDTPQEALAYDSMDHAEVNRVFVDDFLRAAINWKDLELASVPVICRSSSPVNLGGWDSDSAIG